MVNWQLWERLGLYVDIVGGALFLLLGLAVLLVRPRTRASLAFSLFAVPFGIDHVLRNIYFLDSPNLGGYNITNGVLWGISGVGLLWLLLEYPRRSTTSRAMKIWTWGGTAAVTVLAWTFLTVLVWDDFTANFAARAGIDPIPLAAAQLGNAGFTAASQFFLLAVAAKHLRAPPGDAAGMRVITYAFGPYVFLSAIALFEFAVNSPNPLTRVGWVVGGLPVFAISATWLWQAARESNRARARASQRLGLFVLAVMAAGSLLYLIAPPDVAWSNLGLFGLARIFGVFALAYMIVRHRMFDLDVKLQWTISRGTMASIFIAVFFVVGVVAENFLTDRYGWAIGGIGAGLLLFAIAPLQNLGQRVAESAMPNTKPLADRSTREREAMFSTMLQEAWADGHLSRAERRVLEVAREKLGVSVERAHGIELALAN